MVVAAREPAPMMQGFEIWKEIFLVIRSVCPGLCRAAFAPLAVAPGRAVREAYRLLFEVQALYSAILVSREPGSHPLPVS